jgi:CO/xanthine dehydrogenase Mo-binding subunit
MTSRREFLSRAAALVVGFTAAGDAQVFQGLIPSAPQMNLLDSWIAIGVDGVITAYSGKEELGQGIATVQQQLVAEELSVPFDRVNLLYCDTSITPDQAHTSGSQSHPANFNHQNLALAGATAREVLFQMASDRLGVPVDQLAASDGVIRVRSDQSRQVTYGQLAGAKKFNVKLSTTAKRKPASEWTVLGKPVPRPDLPAMATGQFEYVHNVRVPGMLHGRVVRPPAIGATLMSVDEDSIKGMPGLIKVVIKKDFVGVVAEKPWQAIQAANRLKTVWTQGTGLTPQSGFFEGLRTQKPVRDTFLVDSGDVEQKLNDAKAVLKATYMHPYQMHGSVGSSCAVADVQGDKATIWSATQAVWYQRSACATLLGIKAEGIRVIFRRGSGCYGINGADTATYDAAILSQAVARPVRVQLTRKDEMAWENYGNAFLIDVRAGLDDRGNIVAWDQEAWSPGKGNRPGPNVPGNVITGTLLGYEPDPFVPRSPAPKPANFNNNSNGIPSYLAARFDGKTRGTGTVTGERVLVHNLRGQLFTGPLRSPARLQNSFAQESFMDELAAHANADPVEYRLRHLSFDRMKDVVRAAAKAANWTPRPSPAPGLQKTGIATGRGMACVAYEGDNGYAALVAEVEVNQANGHIAVKRIWVANDSGPVSNPDGLRNQIEGGALQGLSRALGEEVTWDAEKVTSIDWNSYHSLPIGFEVPVIETVLLNRPDEEATGAGETSITIIAAAVGNAVFDATGARLRRIPFTPERVKAALAARA